MAKNTLKSQVLNTTRAQKTNSHHKSKKETCIALLKRVRGASLADLQKLTGVTLVSEQTSAGVRRYRIEAAKAP